jgi:hypothetical protein
MSVRIILRANHLTIIVSRRRRAHNAHVTAGEHYDSAVNRLFLTARLAYTWSGDLRTPARIGPWTPYLQKPFAPRALALKVRDVLDRGPR